MNRALSVTLGAILQRRGFAIALLGACAVQSGSNPSVTASAANCPEPAAGLSPLTPQPQAPVYEQFDFRPREIRADADTVAFPVRDYTFVFCRSDRSWTVQPAMESDSSGERPSYEEQLQNIANPEYQALEVSGETYQYRVVLKADWLDQRPDPNQPVPPDQQTVTFELLPPGRTEPIRETLYTLQDVQDLKIGGSLGEPRITSSSAVGETLWWAVSSSQGEGTNGVATILHYDLGTQTLEVIQPQALLGEQITDMAIAGDPDQPVLWLGTMRSGEGNPYLPAQGLVAYRPAEETEPATVTRYTVENSPVVGAIPHELFIEDETLWVGTGNGACAVEWQTADQTDSWDCWRFSAIADLPVEGVPLYPSLLAETAATTLTEDAVEVLWAMPTAYPESENVAFPSRYEVRYDPGFEASLNYGAEPWPDFAELPQNLQELGHPPVMWSGREWHWDGQQFVRGLDAVAVNYVGGGPHGIEPLEAGPDPFLHDVHAIRGDLDLLELTRDGEASPLENRTRVRHHSGWVDADQLEVYPTVLPHEVPTQRNPNPLLEVAGKLSEG